MEQETKDKIKSAGIVLLKEVIRACVTFGSVVIALFLGQ